MKRYVGGLGIGGAECAGLWAQMKEDGIVFLPREGIGDRGAVVASIYRSEGKRA